tara:strand:- start:10714 stop:11847 length:1134 start_codon:yes stop_codon:yes gene_type:complete
MSFVVDFFQTFKVQSEDTRLFIQVFAIVFFTLLLNFICSGILAHLHKKSKLTTTPWDESLIDSARKPAAVLIWLIGIAFAAKVLHQHTDSVILESVGTVRDIGIIVCIGWFLQRFIHRVEENLLNRQPKNGKHVDQTTINAIGKLLRISVLITLGLIILQQLGFSISGVLAFGGIGGIAIGFAAKELLSNFFGALIIYMDRPFAVGDWIRSPDRDIEGTVTDIGWRITKITTFDKRPLYVPNSTFTTIAVENPSRMSHRRIFETIGVRYDDGIKLEGIVTEVRDMLMKHEEIDQEETLMVNFDKFAASSLDFFIYTFTRTTNWIRYHEVKQDVLFQIMQIIEKHGAEVAFPTSTLHVPEPVHLFSEPNTESVKPASS